MSFHTPLHNCTYFHEYHDLPAASTRRLITLTLTLSWSYSMEAGLPPDSVEVDGSAFKSFVAYMEAGATCMLPCKEVDGSKWKLT